MVQLKKKDKIYYARILPKVNIYDVCDLIVNNMGDTYFVAVDKRDKRSYLFENSDIGKIVFKDRSAALSKVIEAEKSTPKTELHIESEEY